MLGMGFEKELKEITSMLPSSQKRQTLLFSATFPQSILAMSENIQTSPVSIKDETIHKPQKIKQTFIELDAKEKKTDALIRALCHYKIESALIFCRTKAQCDELSDLLSDSGFWAAAIHGDLEQAERDEVLAMFSAGSLNLLVATDVAARGLDIKGLASVINFDLTKDPETHVHRVGRTGRADKEGMALSLFKDKERSKVREIEAYMNLKFPSTSLSSLVSNTNFRPLPPMVSIVLGAGKKNKMRPTDILGALTAKGALTGDKVGKINIFPYHSYVAVDRTCAKKALSTLSQKNIKGRRVKARILDC